MTNSHNTSPCLSFKKDGSPYSEQFNDIYFDSESGYQQSEEIFVQGNQIPERVLTATDTFTIAETGFGTGLNFLLTLQAYQNLLDKYPNKTPAKIHLLAWRNIH